MDDFERPFIQSLFSIMYDANGKQRGMKKGLDTMKNGLTETEIQQDEKHWNKAAFIQKGVGGRDIGDKVRLKMNEEREIEEADGDLEKIAEIKDKYRILRGEGRMGMQNTTLKNQQERCDDDDCLMCGS